MLPHWEELILDSVPVAPRTPYELSVRDEKRRVKAVIILHLPAKINQVLEQLHQAQSDVVKRV